MKRQHHGITLAVLAVAGLSFALLQTMVAPALPAIQREYGASTTAVTWVLTVYLLTASIATPVLGRLGDMFGKERLLVIVLLVLAAGTVIVDHLDYTWIFWLSLVVILAAVVDAPYSRWMAGSAGATIVCSSANDSPDSARTASVSP